MCDGGCVASADPRGRVCFLPQQKKNASVFNTDFGENTWIEIP